MAIDLTPKQVEGMSILTDPDKTRILFTGGSRSGKTYLIIEYLIQRAYQFPGSRQIIVRKHLVDARMSIWNDTLKKYLDTYIPAEDYTLRQSELRVIFANGSEIWLAGLDDGERSTKILGNEYITIFCNEAVQLQYSVIQILITRLAQKCIDADDNVAVNKMILDCNPSYPRHWLKIWGVDYCDPEETPPKPLKNAHSHASLHFTPYDNEKHLPDGYIEQLDALPYVQRERMLLGNWCGGEGAIFKDFREETHVIDPFEIPAYWYKYMAIDFGFDHPAGILWAAYDFATDTVYVYDEYKESGKTIDELAEIIKKRAGNDLYLYGTIWADHAKADRAFLHKNDILTTPAKKSVLDGINAVNQRLRVSRTTGQPRLKVFSDCTKLIDELYSYEWHESKSLVSDAEKPVALNDDLVDPLRYIVYGLDKSLGITVI